MISLDGLSKDRFTIGKEALRLDKGVGEKLLEKCFLLPPEARDFRKATPAIWATIWHDECIILRVPVNPLFQQSDSAMVVLLSKKRGRPFATMPSGVFPPLPSRSCALGVNARRRCRQTSVREAASLNGS